MKLDASFEDRCSSSIPYASKAIRPSSSTEIPRLRLRLYIALFWASLIVGTDGLWVLFGAGFGSCCVGSLGSVGFLPDLVPLPPLPALGSILAGAGGVAAGSWALELPLGRLSDGFEILDLAASEPVPVKSAGSSSSRALSPTLQNERRALAMARVLAMRRMCLETFELQLPGLASPISTNDSPTLLTTVALQTAK